MAVHFGAMAGCAHNGHDVGERKDRLLSALAKVRPVSHMVFRPEEMDAASCVRPVLCPLAQRDINIPVDAGRGFMLYDAVTDNYFHGLAGIQARGIYLHCLSWECPADRQGFKSSLCEPFLMAVHRKAILRRLIVERCE